MPSAPTQPGTSNMTYETLTPEDLLSIARDALRGRESDHYRLSLLDARSSGGPDRMATLRAEIDSIRSRVRELEAQIGQA